MLKIPRFITRLYSCEHMVKEDMVSGDIPADREIYDHTLQMALPSTVETVLVGLISMISTMMVGVLGSSSIAAVGITGQPRFIFLAVIMSLNIGVTAIVSRRKGEEDIESARSTLKQAIVISAAVSIVLTIASHFVAYPLLSFAGAGSDIIDDSVAYFRIMMLGIPFTSLSLTINAAQRGAGNTRISMRTNIVANVVNVIVGYLLISGHFGFPRLGVSGAAIAIVLGNVTAFVMSVHSVTRRASELYILSKKGWRFDRKTMRGFTSVGGSSLVEQLFMRFGFFMFTKVVASLGTLALSTHQICMNIVVLSFSFSEGLGIASSALIGQSLGAKRPDMAIIYGKVCQRLAFSISVLLSFVFLFGRRLLVMMFTDEADIIQLGSYIILVIAVISFAQMSQIVISGSLRGAGDAKYVAFVSFFTIGILRPGLAYVFAFPFGLGLIGIWFSFLVDQVVRLALNYMRFSTGKWVKIKL